MTAKEYLNRIRVLDRQIRRDTVILKSLADGIENISIGAIRYDKDRVCSSVDGAGFTDKVIAIVDKEKILQDNIFKLADERFKILGQINAIEDDDMAELVFKRYVEYKSFEEIAYEMHLTYGTIRNMHGRALVYFADKFLK